MKLRFTYPSVSNAWIIIESIPSSGKWKIHDTSSGIGKGIEFNDLNDFHMHNIGGVEDLYYTKYGMTLDEANALTFFGIQYEPGSTHFTPNPKPKGCQHEWKQRVMFTSIEEYCNKCPELKLVKLM